MASAGDLVDDKYRLVKLLAEGGMATVWEAEHLTLETRVAIKLLTFDGDWLDGGRERFLEEARIAATIKHRNVVQTLDFGATDEGVPFIVMELLDGDSLAEHVEAEAPMAVEEALDLADQILGALAAVHAKGIVHRDLKPENVLFSHDTDGRYPKLIDFGISKSVESRRRAATRPGVVLGTPEFMSPEQAAGLDTIDHRTDLYSVGVILYEMLSGALPYESERTSNLLIKVIAGGAPTLEDRGVDVPRALSDVVARAMAVEPDQRFESATEMREALASVRQRLDERTSAPAPRRRVSIPDLDPPPRDDRDPVDQARWTMAALAALLLLGIPVALWARAALTRDEPDRPVQTAQVEGPAEPARDAAPSHPARPTLRSADDHHVYVHLTEFPEDATLLLDDTPFTPAEVEQMRRGDVIEVPVPRRRGRPFDLRIVREGYEDWRMRRWTVRDFESRVIMEPILE